MVVGGAAAPQSMIEAYEKKYGLNVMHAWGMTEMTPLGTVSRPKSYQLDLPEAELFALRAKQGTPVPGVEIAVEERGLAVAPQAERHRRDRVLVREREDRVRPRDQRLQENGAVDQCEGGAVLRHLRHQLIGERHAAGAGKIFGNEGRLAGQVLAHMACDQAAVLGVRAGRARADGDGHGLAGIERLLCMASRCRQQQRGQNRPLRATDTHGVFPSGKLPCAPPMRPADIVATAFLIVKATAMWGRGG